MLLYIASLTIIRSNQSLLHQNIVFVYLPISNSGEAFSLKRKKAVNENYSFTHCEFFCPPRDTFEIYEAKVSNIVWCIFRRVDFLLWPHSENYWLCVYIWIKTKWKKSKKCTCEHWQDTKKPATPSAYRHFILSIFGVMLILSKKVYYL